MGKKRRSVASEGGSVNGEEPKPRRRSRSPNRSEIPEVNSPVHFHHTSARQDSQSFLPAPEWLSKMYEADAVDDRPQRSCLSTSVLLFSVFFILFGIGIAVASVVEQHGERFLKLCPHCQNVINAAYISASIVVVIGILGVVAAVLRRRVLAVPFTILMIVLAVGFIGMGTITLIYKQNVSNVDLETLWRKAVLNDPQFVCSVQDNLVCSGFGNGCCSTNATPVSLNSTAFCYINTPTGLDLMPGSGAPVSWPSDDCVSFCSGNSYNTTCQAAIHNEVTEYLAPVVAILFVLAFVLLSIGLCSLLMTRKPPREEHENLV